jgi:hypothetical protein
MFHTPHPDLNEEERTLLGSAPEECLRHAVQRGAFSLDAITEHLTPRAAAVVRSIVTEERPPVPAPPLARTLNTDETGPGKSLPLGAALHSIATGERVPESFGESGEEELSRSESRSAGQPRSEASQDVRWQANYESLGAWPGLQNAVDEGILTAGEALGVANTIDRTLGRYMTGTLYAAP